MWMAAKLIRMTGKNVTVQLEDRNQPEDMPLSAIRCPRPQTPCRHGASCIKFGCMFMHPEARRKDCPRGAKCCEAHCVFLHPVTRCGHAPKTSSEQPRTQPPNVQRHSQPYSTPKQTRQPAESGLSTKNNNLTAKTKLQPSSQVLLPTCEQNSLTTSQAEIALRLLLKVVDSDEEFMSSCENRRLLEILGLKAKKKQAILDENFLIAHTIKNQIDNLFNTK
jgi:hypothetical protein